MVATVVSIQSLTLRRSYLGPPPFREGSVSRPRPRSVHVLVVRSEAHTQSVDTRAVVVTGASSGIGKAICSELRERGFRVYGSVRTQKEVDNMKAMGQQIHPLVFDVRDAAAVQAAAKEVRSHLGGKKLYGLINNAGVMSFGPLLYQPISEFQNQLDINLIGVQNVMQAFVPLLGTDRSLEGPPGRVVQNSSLCGTTSVPFLGAYSASKQGMEGLSQGWRRELIPYGIDVVVVAPGAVKTPIWANALAVSEKYLSCEYRPALEKWVETIKKSGESGATPEETAKAFVKALTADKPPIHTSVSTGPPLPLWSLRLFPQRIIDEGFARSFGITRDMLQQNARKSEPSEQEA